jgi:hypothetical protein
MRLRKFDLYRGKDTKFRSGPLGGRGEFVIKIGMSKRSTCFASQFITDSSLFPQLGIDNGPLRKRHNQGLGLQPHLKAEQSLDFANYPKSTLGNSPRLCLPMVKDWKQKEPWLCLVNLDHQIQ